MSPETNLKKFDHLFIFGRPASGKSEFIDFMKKAPAGDRLEKFYIGNISEFDDYAILAEKFKEDDVWNKVLGKRKYTVMENENHVIKDLTLYSFAINVINDLIVEKHLSDREFYKGGTVFIEFSRGGEISYFSTIKMFDPIILKEAAILYVKTSFDECWRRNLARYEEKKKFDVLKHMIPRQQMERLYLEDDWEEITKGAPLGQINVNGVNIPFVTMDNEIESKDSVVLAGRYGKVLEQLIGAYRKI